MTTRKLISFDWAMKRILRSKANFGVLEGFLSELLHDNIRIQEILESESNKETANDKFNRVDMKVKNHKDELLIIEVQYDRLSSFPLPCHPPSEDCLGIHVRYIQLENTFQLSPPIWKRPWAV